MTYGIIIILLYVLTVIYRYYNFRTVDSSIQFFEKARNQKINQENWIHYTTIAISGLLDISIIGYLIYAVCNI